MLEKLELLKTKYKIEEIPAIYLFKYKYEYERNIELNAFSKRIEINNKYDQSAFIKFGIKYLKNIYRKYVGYCILGRWMDKKSCQKDKYAPRPKFFTINKISRCV